jgi:AbrB family looped-hinge helix DNA binding protein
MNAVKLSPKYQVVIPREVRESLHLIPGQMMQVVAYGNRIELMPSKAISEMRGFLKGIDTTVEREADRL